MRKRIYISETIPVTRPLVVSNARIVGRHGGVWWRVWVWMLVRLRICREVRTEAELRNALKNTPGGPKNGHEILEDE